jgi:U3 small nucleolar RNA-associated protein 14
MSKKRVAFEDLFEYDNNNNLTLKMKIIINNKQYQVGDQFNDHSFGFPFKNPEDYFYIVNLLADGDTLDGWCQLP